MKEYEILKLTKQYESTGIIDNALIPYFDQEGRWLGDKANWRHSVWVTSRRRMRYAVLLSSRRTRRCRSGTILLTSFHWSKAAPALITHSSVEGSVLVTANASIRAPALRQIGGHFYACSKETIRLPNLTSVEGNFHADKCIRLQAPRLQRVGGNVLITGNMLPRLESVGGRFAIRWVFVFIGAKLIHVGGDW